MSEFHAIRSLNGGQHYFSWESQDFFPSRESLLAAIESWKKVVTPSMAETVKFEIIETKL